MALEKILMKVGKRRIPIKTPRDVTPIKILKLFF